MDNTAKVIYLCHVLQGVLRQHWTEFFLCIVVCNLFGNIAQDSYLCYVFGKVLGQYWSEFFLFNVGPWLTDNFYEESNLCNVVLTMLGQYCIGIYIFFYQGFLSQTLAIHRTAREDRRPSFIPLYHFHRLTNIETFISNFACEITIMYF